MILAYSIKWAVALTLLYSCYGLLLRHETFYRFNRAVLIFIMLISAVLPVVHVVTEHPTVVNKGMMVLSEQLSENPAAMTGGEVKQSIQSATESPTWAVLMLLIYEVGLMCCLLRYLLAVWSVIRVLRGGKKEHDYIINDAVESPFSCFGYIVINQRDLQENGVMLLAHERAHRRQGHSFDLLLCDICACLQWWNPFVWMLRKDLLTVHEFEADAWVVKSGITTRHEYQQLLIEKATNQSIGAFVNGMNQASLKQRMKQMFRRPSSPVSMLKVIYLIPLILLVVMILAQPAMGKKMADMATKRLETIGNKDVLSLVKKQIPVAPLEMAQDSEEAQEKKAIPQETVVESNEVDTTVYEQVDQYPVFGDGEQTLLDYMHTTLHYPQIASECKVSGRLLVKLVVEKDGTVSSPTILANHTKSEMSVRGERTGEVVTSYTEKDEAEGYLTPDELEASRTALEWEVVAMVEQMPMWTPGKLNGKLVRTQVILPVTFLIP